MHINSLYSTTSSHLLTCLLLLSLLLGSCDKLVELRTYKITFDSGEGSPIPAQVVKEKEKAVNPAAPTREGYDFGGWYRDKGFQQSFNFNTPLTTDITIYAKWVRISYKVTFSSEGNIDVPSQQTVAYGEKLSRPNDPTRTGYEFKGWYVDKSLLKSFNFANTTITADVTLYAKWEKVVVVVYTVTFESNEGSTVESQRIVKGQKVIKPPADPTRTGYTFIGWYADNGFQLAFDFVNTATTADVTLYAKWEKVVVAIYTVTFESNGGSTVELQRIVKGQKAIKPPVDPTRTDYIFMGWYADNGFQRPFDFVNTTITADVTLYAKWEKVVVVVYTVTFESNGGSTVESQRIVKGQKAIKPPVDPIRTDYTFMGWYADNGFQRPFDFANTTITADVTLYAKWEKVVVVVYTVTFSSEGGVLVPSKSVVSGEKAQRPAVPVREGYLFANWYRDASFTQVFDFANTAITANITLYAKWNEAFKVTFDTQGGTPIEPILVAKGSQLVLPTPPTKDKLVLLGWYYDLEGISRFFAFNTISSDITLYAKYGFLVPDVNFRNKLKTIVPTAFVGEVMRVGNNVAVTTQAFIYVAGSKIKSLVGIEYFTAITTLYCSNNLLDTLDVSKNTKLQSLYCNVNNLTRLDVSKNTVLSNLECNYNKLSSLDLSNNTVLSYLKCKNNLLTDLDLSKNAVLRELDCQSNNLISLNVSGNTALQELSCQSNKLSSLDLSGSTLMKKLYCNNNVLTRLDILRATSLEQVYCQSNKLTRLDVSGNMSLNYLDCHQNELTILDVSRNADLAYLDCHQNKLPSLDVSRNTLLTYLNCQSNKLTSLNVLGATALRVLLCVSNELTNLNLSSNTALRDLRCFRNKLVYLDMRGMSSIYFLNIGFIDDAINPLTTLKVLDSVKSDGEIYTAKNARKTAITITTYNSDRTTVVCNNYDPVQNKCLD